MITTSVMAGIKIIDAQLNTVITPITNNIFGTINFVDN